MASRDQYRAVGLQLACRAVNRCSSRAEARELMGVAIGRVREAVAGTLAFVGSDCELVVLPEYLLTGHPLGEPIDVWADRAAIAVDGPEYAALAEIATDHEIHLAGNAYEVDEHFPGLYFQASFVIDPAGETVLRYRRLHSLFAPTPHDVLDRYVEVYGAEALFPVARTAIGNLAAIASEEILFPELARCLAARGAEVFVHSTSEAGSPDLTRKDVARRARAIENVAYVVSANTAGVEGSPIPAASADGGSQLVDYEGRLLVRAGQGESLVASADIDLAALRRARRRPGMENLASRSRFELYADTYASRSIHPPNTLDGVVPERSVFRRTQQEVIDRLAEEGVI